MKKSLNIPAAKPGFSLAEVLASMIIGSLVLIAVMTIYSRAEHTAAALTRSLTDSRRPYEALQLMAEDLDKMISNESDTNIIMINRYINNYAAAIFAVQVHHKDATNKDQQYEQITWQCNTNKERDINDLVLYRCYEGIAPEDNLLDKNRDISEKNVYVPICSGVTYFGIDVITGDDKTSKVWPNGMPLGIILTISFAKPYKDVDGRYNVPEDKKYSRTIALDKSRKIKFDIQEDETLEGGIDTIEVNTPAASDSSANKKVPSKE
jgi:type II secretory pathway component PulJ